MLNNIQINYGQAGLGRPLPGEDFVSSLVFYTSALPAGFTNANRIKEVFSVTDAEALGITNTSIGETRATGSFTIAAIGSNGDTLALNVTTQTGTVSLGTYTKSASETGTTQVATASAAIINAGSTTHGYSATASTSTVTVTAPVGSGVGGNSYVFSNLTTGTISASTVSFTGGVASQIDVLHYHVSEYFRAQPKGDLFIYVSTGSTDFKEVVEVQNFASGKIRQIGVYSQSNFSTTDVTKLQVQADLNTANYKPAEIIYQANFSNVTDLTTLSDLHTLNGKNVSVTLGQDGNAKGYSLWLANGKTIGSVGLTLGAVAFAKVSDSIAWIDKFNMSQVEMETLAFGNGSFYNTLSDGLISNIDSKGYIILRKIVGRSGSYFNTPWTCIAVTSDYSRINNNRTINKASRNERTFLLPALSSPLRVNADGTLTEDTISYFETLATRALEQMNSDAELSAFKITINPVQNVLATGQLVIGVQLVPIGTADFIIVNIGFTVAIA